jgi:antitoxin component YwqK of YwqJK toxin-antitoxin module
MKNWFLSLILFGSMPVFSQLIDPENLSPKVKIYWDANNRKLNSVGSYYVDEITLESTEKHGKWLYYSMDGVLEEERFYYRNRTHGKQIVYYPNKKIKQLYYCKFNVSDSLYKEYNEAGTLLKSGYFSLGSPQGKWQYFYDDSLLWKEEFVSNDTTYLLSYFDSDSAHTQTVINGNGVVNTFYSFGGLKESYTFKNGLRDGPFFENLASGQTSIAGAFLAGKKQGDWVFYFSDGSIEKKQGFKQDSLHGAYLVYFPNGLIRTEGSYVNGDKDGKWIWGKADGLIEMKGAFNKNQQHSDWEYYFDSGELSYKANYNLGKREGEWSYFYKDGTPFRIGNYKNDLKQGEWQTWYEDGTLLMKGSYNQGKEVGEWKNYWPNGRLKNQSFYKKGELNGAWYSFSPEGKLLLFGRYKKDHKKGKWTEFYNNGRKKEEVSYKVRTLKNSAQDVVAMGFKEKQSVEHGTFKAYSQVDFTIKELGKFKQGKKSGKWINYYPGGVVPAVVSTFKNGLLHGEFYQNDRRGNKMNEIHYKNGLKDGLFIVYGSNGKPITQKMFRNGHELQRVSNGNPFSPEK